MSEELLKNIIDFIELKQALHKVDKSPLTVEERYIVELIKYIQELQAEVKEANENAAWWSRRFKALQSIVNGTYGESNRSRSMLVKTLREKTGAGIEDCCKALKECEFDIDKAYLWIMHHGLCLEEKDEIQR